MAEKTKSLAAVVSQEKIATDIYSLILATPAAQKAVAGQFVSVYCKDRTKLLPRPISICEINREAETLRLVYRVTGKGTGTEEFSRLKAGDQVEILGPLGNGFPLTGKSRWSSAAASACRLCWSWRRRCHGFCWWKR